ncbi:PEP-CTERM sorting domain-containing protein [archaeon]|jgi:hypothetical protein|nr:PEP-CTERM sorting domain-containing protein [archaeon]MBT4241411.1 PEP-CTERM sorting domain-containing protein [archaeon]MBT4418232.1 PEP-CTERM sorting domain-containing protein [archaeon]
MKKLSLVGLIGAGLTSLVLSGNAKGEGMLQMENNLHSYNPDLKLIHYDNSAIDDNFNDSWDSRLQSFSEGFPGIYSDIGSDKLSMDYRLPSSDTPFDIELVYNGEIIVSTPNWLQVDMPYGDGWEFEHKDFITLTHLDAPNGTILEQHNVRDVIAEQGGRIDLPDLSPGVYDTGTPYAYFTLGFDEIIPPFTPIFGDIPDENGYFNGIIDEGDVGIVSNGFGMGARYWSSHDALLGDGDLDGDGDVDIDDVRGVALNYGNTGDSGYSSVGAMPGLEGVVGGVDSVHGVPEPTTGWLLALGLIGSGVFLARRYC